MKNFVKRPLLFAGGILIVLYVYLLKLTCRTIRHNDPRQALREQGTAYAYAVLHAHQIATIMAGERGVGAMVSRSADGALIVPVLRAIGVVPVRGSTSRPGRDKGGRKALDQLKDFAREGRPVYIAVDGPRGPRNRVNKGVAILSRDTGAPVFGVIGVPKRRWIIHTAWDRMQVPKPFSSIDFYFTDAILPAPDETVEAYRQRIEDSLNDLERRNDPEEADRCEH